MRRLPSMTLAALLASAPLALAQTATPPPGASATPAPAASAAGTSQMQAGQMQAGAADSGAMQGWTQGVEPQSDKASNITPSDTHTAFAPALPAPSLPADANVGALLGAARQALAQGQTGAAQEALERAETRLLQRAVPASAANQPSSDPVVMQISQALQALGNKDEAGASQIIGQCLASNAPELSV